MAEAVGSLPTGSLTTRSFRCRRCGAEFGTLPELGTHAARLHATNRPGRRPIGDRPMTEAEKKRRQRSMRREGVAPHEAPIAPVAPRQLALDERQAAFEAGRAFRVMEEIAGGMPGESLSAQLAAWVASKPPALDLYFSAIARSPIADVWEDWRRRWLD